MWGIPINPVYLKPLFRKNARMGTILDDEETHADLSTAEFVKCLTLCTAAVKLAFGKNVLPFQDEVQRLAQLTMQGEYAQVRQLASRELAMARDEGGRTVLMLTADTDWTPVPTGKCVEYLLHLGADPSALDTLGNTCAHVAARRDHLRLLALLPFEVKFLVNNEGNTPLMLSAQAGSWRCAKHLLHLLRQWRYNNGDNDRRMRLLKMQNRSKQTALDLARSSGHSELAQVIEM